MAILGNTRKFYLGTAIDTGWTWLTGEQSNSFNRTNTVVEVSDKDSTWQKFISGIKGATAEVTVFADDSDTSQKKLIKSLADGTSVFCFIGTLGSSSTISDGDAFEAIISSISDTNDNGSVSSRSISLQVTGAPVHYPTS